MPLTDAAIRSVKPSKAKTIKKSDGGGLQLWVQPTGSRLWNLAYRFDGRQKKLALGPYPTIGLKEARAKREEAKRLLAAGTDPGQQKKVEKAARAISQANTFDAVADELLAKKAREGITEATLGKKRWILDFARPSIGARPISEISAPEVLAVLRAVEARGRHETAHRLRATIGEVFRFGIATGRAENDPTYSLRGALTTPVVTHRPAITEPIAFGALLRSVAGYDGAPETRIALQLLALTFVRPGELRNAQWSEFDLDAALWIIPAGRMKARKAHRVPLAPQAVALLKDLQALIGGNGYLFPSARSADRCMSENTLNAALRRLGYAQGEATAHGFRATASSLANEAGIWNPDAIEAQLAHVDNDEVRRAYQRAAFWDERVRMMAWWADRCDELRQGARVIPLRA